MFGYNGFGRLSGNENGSVGGGANGSRPVFGDDAVGQHLGTWAVDMFKIEKDQAAIPRDFVQQPPLIPHAIKGYNITKNFNKCFDCHAPARAPQYNATKVPASHFKTREGQELANISPRRYFCNQCHVPQSDAKPLVNNTFTPAAGFKKN